jgi:hypothetical protein
MSPSWVVDDPWGWLDLHYAAPAQDFGLLNRMLLLLDMPLNCND